MTDKKSYVYILFSKPNGTLYTGVTSNLQKRVWEHKNKVYQSFTSKYGVDKLGYYEVYSDVKDAIAREKQLKGGSRKKICMKRLLNEWIASPGLCPRLAMTHSFDLR